MNILNDIEQESRLLRRTTDKALAIRLASVDRNSLTDLCLLNQGKLCLEKGKKSNALARHIGLMAADATNEDALVLLELMERLEE